MTLGRGLKKGVTTPMQREVHNYLLGLSKAALLDCLADALGVMAGGDPETVELERVRAFVQPRLRVRGDREPRVAVAGVQS
jgi:hypothetical protein